MMLDLYRAQIGEGNLTETALAAFRAAFTL
jgi:hydroxypyruvate isomerase